jgi:hypothetical protein
MTTAWQGLEQVYSLGFYGFMAFLLYAMTGPAQFSFWFQIGDEAKKAKMPPKVLFVIVVVAHTLLWPIQAVLMMAKSGAGDDGSKEL